MSEMICSALLSEVLILAYYALTVHNLFQLMSIFEKFIYALLGSFDTLKLFITKELRKSGSTIS